jgi:hypothetical protein
VAAFSHFIFNIAVNQAAPTAFANIGYRFYAVSMAELRFCVLLGSSNLNQLAVHCIEFMYSGHSLGLFP